MHAEANPFGNKTERKWAAKTSVCGLTFSAKVPELPIFYTFYHKQI